MLGTHSLGKREGFNFSARFKLQKGCPLRPEMRLLPSLIYPYGLWNVSEELDLFRIWITNLRENSG